MNRRFLILILSLFSLRAVAADRGPQLGLQTYTCRNLTFEQVLDFAVEHHLKYLEFYPAHLDPKAPREETLRKKAAIEAKGLVAYSFGVNGTSKDKEANRQLFEFAKMMGMSLIIVEPKDPLEWDNLEELVKEYDIRLAIHNHRRDTVYGDPATVRQVLASRDKRIGVCLDVGWVTAAGFDAADIFRRYGDRVYDLHLKDKKPDKSDKKSGWADTPIGRGAANYTGLFRAIKEAGWSGVMAIETDSAQFAKAPGPLVEGAEDFFRQQVKVER